MRPLIAIAAALMLVFTVAVIAAPFVATPPANHASGSSAQVDFEVYKANGSIIAGKVVVHAQAGYVKKSQVSGTGDSDRVVGVAVTGANTNGYLIVQKSGAYNIGRVTQAGRWYVAADSGNWQELSDFQQNASNQRLSYIGLALDDAGTIDIRPIKTGVVVNPPAGSSSG